MKYLFQSLPVLQLVLIDLLHPQALTSLQDWREGLCWLLRKSSSLLSPKTPVHFSSRGIRELIISAVLLAALLLHQEQAGVPSTGMELPSMQRQLRLGKYCHRPLGQPSFKKFEGPQTYFAHDSMKSVQENEITLAVAVVCFSCCLNRLVQNCSSSPLVGLQSQEQSS